MKKKKKRNGKVGGKRDIYTRSGSLTMHGPCQNCRNGVEFDK